MVERERESKSESKTVLNNVFCGHRLFPKSPSCADSQEASVTQAVISPNCCQTPALTPAADVTAEIAPFVIVGRLAGSRPS